MRIFSASLVLITPILCISLVEFAVLFCRPTPSWLSQDSLTSCKYASALSVRPGYPICALINTLFERSAENRYVILLLFAMSVVLGLPASAKFT